MYCGCESGGRVLRATSAERGQLCDAGDEHDDGDCCLYVIWLLLLAVGAVPALVKKVC